MDNNDNLKEGLLPKLITKHFLRRDAGGRAAGEGTPVIAGIILPMTKLSKQFWRTSAILLSTIMASAQIQTLLRFLSQDAKVPLATAMGKTLELQKANLITWGPRSKHISPRV